MKGTTVVFDHVHIISADPEAAASWYVDKLGATIFSKAESLGAVQIRVDFKTAMVIVRGTRPGEKPGRKPGGQWGVDHFGVRIEGDFDGLCNELKKKGVVFTEEPRDVNPTLRIAFIKGPDDVIIELLWRK
jgi:catechol 2,3-dioxygenase-like lactoylglutathione lyase family enzyme